MNIILLFVIGLILIMLATPYRHEQQDLQSLIDHAFVTSDVFELV